LWLEEKIFPIRKAARKPLGETSKGQRGKGKRKRAQPKVIEAEAELKRRAIAPVESELPEEEAMELMLALQLSEEELAEMVREDREPVNEQGLPLILAEDEQRIGEEEEYGVQGGKLSYLTIDGYVSAVAELYKIQCSLQKSTYPSFRGAAFTSMMDTLRGQQDNNSREAFIDRGLGGVVEGYSDEEYLQLNHCLLRDTDYATRSFSYLNLSTRLNSTWGHAYVLRGESMRRAELCDLALLKYPRGEGQTPCYAAVMTMSQGKMNKYGRKVYMGAMRHKDARLCPLGALAQYLFWRWHMSGEKFPSFRCRRDWYRRKVLVGRDADHEISYPAQLLATVKAFAAAGISSKAKVHAKRRASARSAEVHGVAEAQVRYLIDLSHPLYSIYLSISCHLQWSLCV
jgi:hypothetical protein